MGVGDGKGDAVGCGAKCAKFMLIIFNVIFWISGGAILGVGIWLRVDKEILNILKLVNIDQSDPMLDIAAYVLIGIGAFVFIVGFFGCCGAIKENKCMLGFYIFLLLIVMAGELAAGIMALIYKNNLIGKITEKLQTEFNKNAIMNSADNYTLVGELFLYAQYKMLCCGIKGADDYKPKTLTAKDSEGVTQTIPFPPTCCKTTGITDPEKATLSQVTDWATCKDEHTSGTESPEQFYNIGCEDGLKAWIEKHSVILIGVGIGVACLEVFGLIFSICLCRNLGEEVE